MIGRVPRPVAELPDPAEARTIRERARWSRNRMATELGVTEQSIVRWEAGVVPRGINLLAYLALLARLDQEARARDGAA